MHRSWRRTDRKNVNWLAYYERRGGTCSWHHSLEDLSEDGGFLRTSRPLPPGQRLELVLVDKEGQCCVKTRAEVMWRGRKERHRGMGIRFEHNRTSRKALRTLIVEMEHRNAQPAGSIFDRVW